VTFLKHQGAGTRNTANDFGLTQNLPWVNMYVLQGKNCSWEATMASSSFEKLFIWKTPHGKSIKKPVKGWHHNVNKYSKITVTYSACDHADNKYLLRPRQRWWGIVMSTSVCVSVCVNVYLSVRNASLEPHAWSLPNFLCMLPMAMAMSSCGTMTKS